MPLCPIDVLYDGQSIAPLGVQLGFHGRTGEACIDMAVDLPLHEVAGQLIRPCFLGTACV